MNCHNYYPNRTPRLNLAPGDTNPHCVGKSGALYSSYASLEAAEEPWPGREFPTGIPSVNLRSIAAAGNADGSPMFFLTNSKLTPGNYDDMISGSGQQFNFDNDGVKILWIAATASNDHILVFGMF